MHLILRIVVNGLALMLVAYFYSGVSIDSPIAAIIAAAVLGIVNAVIRPVLVFLTFPVTVLTIGLFLFVINALMFWLAAELVPGFRVSGFMAALIGSVMYSIITTVTSWLISPSKSAKKVA
jgi:putative membrane protein